MSSINMAVGWDEVDPAYKRITHHKKWAIPWMEGEF